MPTNRDDRWRKVLGALEDSKWDLRTVEGIAKETHLPAEDVEKLLRQYQSMLRVAVTRDRRPAFALKTRPRKRIREFITRLQALASN